MRRNRAACNARRPSRSQMTVVFGVPRKALAIGCAPAAHRRTAPTRRSPGGCKFGGQIAGQASVSASRGENRRYGPQRETGAEWCCVLEVTGGDRCSHLSSTSETGKVVLKHSRPEVQCPDVKVS